MPNVFGWIGLESVTELAETATATAGTARATETVGACAAVDAGEPPDSDRAGSELGRRKFVARPRAAATFKYVHSNSRVVQFEHGGPRSSHLTRRLLHWSHPLRDLVCARRGGMFEVRHAADANHAY